MDSFNITQHSDFLVITGLTPSALKYLKANYPSCEEVGKSFNAVLLRGVSVAKLMSNRTFVISLGISTDDESTEEESSDEETQETVLLIRSKYANNDEELRDAKKNFKDRVYRYIFANYPDVSAQDARSLVTDIVFKRDNRRLIVTHHTSIKQAIDANRSAFQS